MDFINLKAQQYQTLSNGKTLKQDIQERINKVIEHGKYIIGPEVSQLENALANYVGVKHCISTSSGTDSLLIALLALGVKAGDEVITTPFSFIATAEMIALIGAIPIFVDIDPKTYNIDPSKIESAITKSTKAIIPVSLYGQPADFKEINLIAKKYSIPVIEDGAQSFGSTQDMKLSCNLSTIGTTSFFPSKPLGCYGDGGACFTNNGELADKMRCISRHGQEKRYFHTDVGLNGRMDTIQAAILLSKLELFQKEVKARQKIGKDYISKMNFLGEENLPYIEKDNTSVFAQFTIKVNSRENIKSFLSDKGIPTAIHYPLPLPDQPSIKMSKSNLQTNDIFRNSTKLSNEVLSLPMHPYLTEMEQNNVVDAIEEYYSKKIK